MVAIEKLIPTSAAGNDLALLRLLQLCSVNLPVGGYSFSQGMETAVDRGWIKSEQQTYDWLRELLDHGVARTDLPLLRRQLSALCAEDSKQYWRWNAFILACRETKELRLTDSAQGQALVRVLGNLEIDLPESQADTRTDVSFVSAFALAAHQWHISAEQACLGFAWAWLENQVSAATKLVPLGQTQAQRLLQTMQPQIAEAVKQSGQLADADIGSSMPALAIASCWHEHQYSRLFRS